MDKYLPEPSSCSTSAQEINLIKLPRLCPDRIEGKIYVNFFLCFIYMHIISYIIL